METLMTPPRPMCPSCKVRLDKIRLSESGAKYGCDKCGKWFVSGQLAPADGDPPAVAGAPGNQLQPLEPPELHGLTKRSIILGLKSATLLEAVGELVPKALHGTGKAFSRSSEIADTLKKQAAGGASEFHKGLVFLHMRLDDLQEKRAAMGISADGLSPGSAVGDKVFVVALFLRPSREPGYDVPLWTRRKLCNERAVYKLRTAPDLDAVLRILRSI